MYTLKSIEFTHVRHGNIPGLSVGHVDGAPPGIKNLYSCKILPVHTKKYTLFKITCHCLHNHTCGGREPLSQVHVYSDMYSLPESSVGHVGGVPAVKVVNYHIHKVHSSKITSAYLQM